MRSKVVRWPIATSLAAVAASALLLAGCTSAAPEARDGDPLPASSPTYPASGLWDRDEWPACSSDELKMRVMEALASDVESSENENALLASPAEVASTGSQEVVDAQVDAWNALSDDEREYQSCLSAAQGGGAPPAADADAPPLGEFVSQGTTTSGTVEFVDDADGRGFVFTDLMTSGSSDIRVQTSMGELARNPDGYWWVDAEANFELGVLEQTSGSFRFDIGEIPVDFMTTLTLYDYAERTALGSARIHVD